jgi:hypothetical protein
MEDRDAGGAGRQVTMAVLPLPEAPGSFCFSFDSANRILLARFEGLLTDQLLEEFYRVAGIHWTATAPRAGIADYSAVTEVAVSSDFIRHLANQEPSAEVSGCPRFLVVPRTHAFGLARMFQLLGETKRPLLHVVRTMDEALAALAVQSTHFDPLE